MFRAAAVAALLAAGAAQQQLPPCVRGVFRRGGTPDVLHDLGLFQSGSQLLVDAHSLHDYVQDDLANQDNTHFTIALISHSAEEETLETLPTNVAAAAAALNPNVLLSERVPSSERLTRKISIYEPVVQLRLSISTEQVPVVWSVCPLDTTQEAADVDLDYYGGAAAGALINETADEKLADAMIRLQQIFDSSLQEALQQQPAAKEAADGEDDPFIPADRELPPGEILYDNDPPPTTAAKSGETVAGTNAAATGATVIASPLTSPSPFLQVGTSDAVPLSDGGTAEDQYFPLDELPPLPDEKWSAWTVLLVVFAAGVVIAGISAVVAKFLDDKNQHGKTDNRFAVDDDTPNEAAALDIAETLFAAPQKPTTIRLTASPQAAATPGKISRV